MASNAPTKHSSVLDALDNSYLSQPSFVQSSLGVRNGPLVRANTGSFSSGGTDGEASSSNIDLTQKKSMLRLARQVQGSQLHLGGYSSEGQLSFFLS